MSNLTCQTSLTINVISSPSTVSVPLHLYHGVDSFSKGTWNYGIANDTGANKQIVGPAWTFPGGPYDAPGLSVTLPVGVQNLGVAFLPQTDADPIPISVETMNITSHTHLYGFDRLWEGFGAKLLDGPHLVPNALPLYTQGTAYSQSPGTAINNFGPVTWSISGGSLPTGLTLDPTTGLISGTPTSTGPFTFTITVADSVGSQATSFTLLNNQPASLNITGNFVIPNHFARWNGPSGLVTMTPVGARFIPVSGVAPLGAGGKYRLPVSDSAIVLFGGASSAEYVIAFESPGWYGYMTGFGGIGGMSAAFVVPIINETPASAACTFDGTTQTNVVGGPALDGSSPSFNVYIANNFSDVTNPTDNIGNNPIGLYTVRAGTANDIATNASDLGLQVCLTGYFVQIQATAAS